jgi:thioredoxin 1
MSKLKTLNETEFNEFIKQGNVIIDFYADWCGPCKMMAPEFESASAELKNIKFAKLNVDEASEIAQTYEIMSIPTMIFFKDGEQANRLTGYLDKSEIIAEAKNTF